MEIECPYIRKNRSLQDFNSKNMKKLISVVAVCIVLCSFNSPQKADEQENVVLEQEDTLLVVENQNSIKFYEKVITDIKGLEHIAIGASISDLKKIYANYIFEEEHEWWYMFSDKEYSFHLYLIVHDDILRGIKFSERLFKLYNGLMVGDPISEIKEKYPNTPIYYDHHTEREIFIIDDTNSRTYIYVKAKDKNHLGDYYGECNYAGEYSTNGEITDIQIIGLKK